MNILETLKFLRKKRKIKQVDMLNEHAMLYQRIESGKKKLTFDEWVLCLTKLEITPSEFFSFVDEWKRDKLNEIEKNYREACSDPYFMKNKDNVLNDYRYLKEIQLKTLSEFVIFIDIKLFFCDKWNEIDPVVGEDIQYFYNLFKNKDFFSYYDYRLFSNIIYYISLDRIDYYLKRMYPIELKEQRDNKTLHVAYLAYPNLVTKLMYEKKFEKARYYIMQGKKQYVSADNSYFHLHLNYLENAINYLELNDKKYYLRTLETIQIIEASGDNKTAQAMSLEFSELCSGVSYDIEQGIYPKNTVIM